MKLYLVQHGEALAKEVDADRPLSDRGRQDVELLARFLGGRGIRVSCVLHSGKTRALQTADLLTAVVAPGVAAEPCAGLAPNDPTDTFAQMLPDWRDDTMIIGHLPFMERLVTRLVTGSDEGTTVAYRPGSLVCLEYDANDAWKIAWMLRPELVG